MINWCLRYIYSVVPVDVITISFHYTYILPLQSPFSDITYELIGDDSADYYFEIGVNDGKIKVKRDLKDDTTIDYQVGSRPIQ